MWLKLSKKEIKKRKKKFDINSDKQKKLEKK